MTFYPAGTNVRVGPRATVGNAAAVTGTGTQRTEQDGVLKDWVRYRFKMSGDAGDRAHFRMLPIKWWNDAVAPTP